MSYECAHKWVEGFDRQWSCQLCHQPLYIRGLVAQVEHEHSERIRLDNLRAELLLKNEELSAYRSEALLVRQILDSMMVPTTVVKPDSTQVQLATWERVRLVIEQRDAAQANYQFMVERAADQKLDGYRELGARAAAAENERDAAIAELKRMKARPAEAEFSRLDTMWQELVRERDAARAEYREALQELARASKERESALAERNFTQGENESLQQQLGVAQAFHNVVVAERNSLNYENQQIRGALRKLLLSRDAAWKGGHDWEEALEDAIQAYGGPS